MVSIALVLILMIGVNYVFTKTSDAVGAGQTMNTFNRDSQSAQAAIFSDFQNINKNPPCFIIGSQIVDQFLNSADAQTGNDPTHVVIDNAGNTQPVITGLYNYRCHRADVVKFFVRGNYQRRSANDGSFTSQTTSDDAFVTLGHALLPTNDSSCYVGPTTDNTSIGYNITQYSAAGPIWTTQLAPNAALAPPLASTGPKQRLGAYAADWVLARSVTLLKDQNTNFSYNGSSTPTALQPNPTGFAEVAYPRFPFTYNNGGGTTTVTLTGGPVSLWPSAAYIPYQVNMTPLGYNSPDNSFYSIKNGYQSTPSYTVPQSSRYDLASVTPEQFRRAIADAILQWKNAGYIGGYLWWNPLIYSLAAQQQQQPTGAAPYYYTPQISYFTTPDTSNAVAPTYQFGTWSPAFAQTNDAGGRAVPPDLARVAANPQIQTPLTSAMVAQIAPYFLQHCSQFIVEYAGDYLTQDGNGNMTGIGPDGQIDFYQSAPNGPRQIRWYGMPRSNSGASIIYGAPNPTDTAANRTLAAFASTTPAPNLTIPISYVSATNPGLPDVIPLRDYYTLYFNQLYGTNTIYQPLWEVDVNFDNSAYYANATSPPVANPNGLNNSFHLYSPNSGIPNDAPINSPRYVAAWYNDMPAMIRVLIKVDDPNDKLKDGPWYVFVFKLK
jgi:hypothetical protein